MAHKAGTNSNSWSLIRYIYGRSISHTYNFINTNDEKQIRERIEAFLRQLDDAPTLCCFNGVKFDIPFIAKRFDVPPSRVHGWMLKLFDIFEICRLVYGSTCSLNNLLSANGKEVKSGSGLQAVEWARDGEWQLLEDYCMRDTVLTHEISSDHECVKLPLFSCAPSHPKSFRHVYCTESHVHKVLQFSN